MADDKNNPAPLVQPAFPPQDENGVDLWEIDRCLRMTPAERLRQAEEFAEFILSARKANGVEWSDSPSFSNDCTTKD